MLGRKQEEKRDQITMVCIDDLVPQDHILRDIERAIDFSFIYELVRPLYCEDNGMVLFKIVLIQYIFGIRSMRQTIREIQVFEQIFERILAEAVEAGFVDASAVFIDGTHIKASANNHKYEKKLIKKEARHYETQLREEINADREAHGKSR